MLGDLITLIGMALFIKFFFEGARQISKKNQERNLSTRTLVMHGVCGVAFVVIGRLIILFV